MAPSCQILSLPHGIILHQAGASTATMLEYDNSAFYYFMVSMLAIYLIPGWLLTLRYVWKALSPDTVVQKQGRSSLEKQKNEKLKEFETGMKKLKGVGFIINMIVLVCGSLLLLYLVFQVSSDSELARFDPYKILELDREATDRQIKRAYKVKAIEYHPDKNLGDPQAKNKFMMIAKAYEALTDEEAKENWKKYGNPDGKQSMEVSIGLPTFLLEEDNHTLILIVYLVGLVIVIPSLVGLWYSYSRKYGENNIMYESYGMFYQHLANSYAGLKSLPETYSLAAEFNKLNKVTDEEEYNLVKSMYQKLQDKDLFKKDTVFMAKANSKLMTPQTIHFLKGNLILHCHLGRVQMKEAKLRMPESWQPNLDAMLQPSTGLVNALVDVSMSSRDLEQIETAMRFSQCVTQGIWPRGSLKDREAPYLQLPNVSKNQVKLMTKATFREYLSQPEEERKGPMLTDEQRIELHRVANIIPNLQVDVRHFVEDEEEIAEGDLVTVEVKLTRMNVAEGNKAEPVYAPFLPVVKEEGWWILFLESTKKMLISMEKVNSQEREVKKEIKFPAPNRSGKYKFEVHVISNSYLGVDQEIPFEMNVISAANLPKYEPHKEDLELDNEVSLFESALGGSNVDSDVSSGEDEEPPSENLQAKVQSKLSEAQLRRRKKRIEKKQGAQNAQSSKSETQSTSDEEADP